MQFGGNVTLIW